MKKLALVLMLVGCGGGKKNDTVETFDGTASLGGKSAKITSCKAIKGVDGQVEFVQLELGLDTGHTVVVDPYLGMQIRKGGTSTKLSDCTRNASESGGSANPAPWAKGTVGLTCPTPDGELVVDATYDCGAKDRPSNRVDREKK